MSSEFSPQRSSFLPQLSLLVVQLLFGTWPIFGKIALRSLPSTGLVAIRTTGAALTFLFLQRCLGSGKNVERSDLLRLALYGLLGVVANQLLFVKGLSLTTAINASLLGTTIPIFAFAVSIALHRDRLTSPKVLGMALAATGVFYLLWPERNFASGTALGNFFIVANSFCYGAYIALSKDMVEKYGPLTVITWIFVFGSIFTLPLGAFTLITGPAISFNVPLLLAIVFIVLFPTVLAYYLNAWALAKVSPGVVAVYVYLQPLFTFAVAPLMLGERPTGTTGIASLLIFAGVAAVTLIDRRPVQNPQLLLQVHRSDAR